MKNHKGIVWAPILIIVATVVVAGIAGYFLFKASNTNEAKNQNVAVVDQANNNASTNQATDKSQYCYEPWNNDTATLICDKLDVGWHYDAKTDRCKYFNGSGCSTSRFTSGEECGRVCGTSKIDPGNPNIRAN